jgi:hypothetical protein
MSYKKNIDYLNCVYNFVVLLSNKANKNNDNKLQNICVLILNYLFKSINNENLQIKDLTIDQNIIMKPFYDYIIENKINLFELTQMTESDFIVNYDDNNYELNVERFVLSHIHYIYSKN